MKYLESFKKYFLPNYKRAIFKAKLLNDKDTLFELQNSIWSNWNLTKNEKIKLLIQEVSLLKERVDKNGKKD